jgi:probable phosphoglycerate mutase
VLKRELVIVRHGETELNRLNTIQGRGENPPLNETGRKQADLLYKKYASENFEVVYTSSLIRTHQTVKRFIDSGIRWFPTPNLDEISWGSLEGKPSTHAVREQFHELVQEWNKGNLEAKIPDGESPLEIQLKHRAFIEHYRSQPYKKILVCTHGRAMRILLATMLNKPLQEMDQFHHRNTSVYRVLDEGTHFTLLEHNNLSHLNE